MSDMRAWASYEAYFATLACYGNFASRNRCQELWTAENIIRLQNLLDFRSQHSCLNRL
jgi:hypothetical protein